MVFGAKIGFCVWKEGLETFIPLPVCIGDTFGKGEDTNGRAGIGICMVKEKKKGKY